MLEQPVGRSRQDAVARRVPAQRRAIEHLFVGVAVGDGPFVARVGEDCGFGGMHAAVRKFVVTADVVEMRMAGDADELALGDQRHMAPEAEMAEPGIEQKVAVTAAHMPHIAAEERPYPRFMDERYVVAHADGLIPVRGLDDRKRAH
jgi:hypothetical protein